MKNSWLITVALVASSMACADDFDPYNLITEHRLLGLRADPPAVREDQTSVLSALVTETDASYSWSWCPVSAGAADGYNCSISHEQLQALVDEALGEGTVEIPPYDLGSDPTAAFTYSLPEALISGFCDLLLTTELPEGIDAPDCTDGFDIQIRLETESAGTGVVGVRRLKLLYNDEQQVNENPTLGDMVARDIETDEEIPLPASGPGLLERERIYEVVLDISESSSEGYLEVPRGGGDPETVLEELTVSWFYEGGDLDKQRTGFIEDDVDFDVLRRNEWTTPASEELEGPLTQLYFVLRDNRGGVAFASREIELTGP